MSGETELVYLLIHVKYCRPCANACHIEGIYHSRLMAENEAWRRVDSSWEKTRYADRWQYADIWKRGMEYYAVMDWQVE